MKNLENQLQKALEECKQLREENYQLKQLLKRNNIPITKNEKLSITYTRKHELKRRIKIFRNLFKGREDTYAIRWEYDNGEKGYSPARAYENKKLLPLTDKVIYDHLIGKRTLGIYPMLKDETCWFLAVDFDKNNWKEDVSAFIDVCNEFFVPASMERSRSGNGCHVWIFFEEAIPAKQARKLGNVLLTRTLEKRYQVGISSYDRLFPNQDTFPKGGFGNLIALPLQHYPRKNDNSVFVDENFHTYHDQWLYLSRIKKMGKNVVEKIINRNYRNDKSISVINEKTMSTDDTLPSKLTVVCKNGIYIPKDNLPSQFISKMIRLATFNNPEYYKAQANRLPTYKIPRMIDCADNCKDYIVLPRGCMFKLKALLK